MSPYRLTLRALIVALLFFNTCIYSVVLAQMLPPAATPVGLTRTQAISNRMQALTLTERTGWVRGEGRIQVKTGAAQACNIKIAVAGWKHSLNGGTVGDAVNAATETVEIVLEYSGTAYRFTWSGANTYAVTPAFQSYVSDAIPGLCLAADSTAFVRYGVLGTSWPEGGSAVVNFQTPATLAQYVLSNAGVSQVFGTGVLTTPTGGSTGTLTGWTPLALLGTFTAPLPVLCDIGDSIADWQNDGSGDGNGNVNFIQRGAWNINSTHVLPSIKMTRGNDGWFQWLTSNSGSADALQWCTHAVVEHGHNDIGGKTLVQLQAAALQVWQMVRAHGVKVYQVKLIPYTDATNTTLGSSAWNVGGLRDQLNTWYDTQVGVTLDGVIDPNTALEDQVRHGFWASNTYSSTDGIHPDSPGAAAGATVFNSAFSAFTYPFLLRRDLDPVANDNRPVGVDIAA